MKILLCVLISLIGFTLGYATTALYYKNQGK